MLLPVGLNNSRAKMNICFLVELPLGSWQWSDGLRGAMRILEQEHSVHYHLDGKLEPTCQPDVIFAWGGTFSNTAKEALTRPVKRCLFFAGGGIDREMLSDFDMVFFENDMHVDEARAKGVKCMKAFGTDTTVFKPMRNNKAFDVIYPGAFGLWKRKDLFTKSVQGLRALTLGNIQQHEMQCYNVCVEGGVTVSADVPQDRLPYFYSMSHTVLVLPVAEIGCQRTVLEAMAMKLPIIVPSDAPLVMEYAKHGGIIVDPEPSIIQETIIENIGKVNTAGYDYVMENMTEKHYAESIIKGLERIC